MSGMGEICLFLRSLRLRRWKMARRMAVKWAYGWTHHSCKQCHGRKGLNPHAACDRCQWENLMRALEEAES